MANNIVGGQPLNGLTVGAGDLVEFLTHTKPGNCGHLMGVGMTVNFIPIT